MSASSNWIDEAGKVVDASASAERNHHGDWCGVVTVTAANGAVHREYVCCGHLGIDEPYRPAGQVARIESEAVAVRLASQLADRIRAGGQSDSLNRLPG